MSELELIPSLILFIAGCVCGAIAVLVTNKISSGNASPTKLKQEMEEYQDKVEAHFEETSEKFKAMAGQYQDLYKHLSVGATTLCRPENIAPGLTDESDPLAQPIKIEKETNTEEKIIEDTAEDNETVSEENDETKNVKSETET